MEQPPTTSAPTSRTDEESAQLVSWIKERALLCLEGRAGTPPPSWRDDLDRLCLDFVRTSPLSSDAPSAPVPAPPRDASEPSLVPQSKLRLLVFFRPRATGERGAIAGSAVMPDATEAAGSVVYFVRPAVAAEDGGKGFLESVVWGEAPSGASVQALYRTMASVYQPAMTGGDGGWPEWVKKDFRAHFHRFMASLTETAHIAKGCTLLYVPVERLTPAAGEASAENKELAQTFEAALIHWTRQINEAIAYQENVELADNAGPLAELEFWQNKAVDLSSIHEQIRDPEVSAVVQLLQASKSSYVEPFLSLSDLIKRGSLEAQDNLRHLSILKGPCEELARAQPREIPDLLPAILHRVRFIGRHSQYYNSGERLQGLLTKVSNEVINRCAQAISLEAVFGGDVEASIRDLSDSVAAVEAWRRLYVLAKSCVLCGDDEAERGLWDRSDSGIFAYPDAFVKRCRDLLEVCEGQQQFAKGKIPAFGGSGGPEIMKGLGEIERAFSKQVQQLKSVGVRAVLDVKATKWNDDFAAFARATKDLEVRTQNLINTAFDESVTVSAGVEIVLTFRALARRESVVRAVEKKAAEVFTRVLEDMGRVKDIFEHGRKQPPLTRNHPPAAGAAMWAGSLLARLEQQFLILPADFAPGSDVRAEAEQEFSNLISALKEYISRIHDKWFSAVEEEAGQLRERLSEPILLRQDASAGLLECNFHRDVALILSEVYYWKQLKMEVPQVAEEIYGQREPLCAMRESCLVIVRQYNDILRRLNAEERALFAERLGALEATMAPGLESLTWTDVKEVNSFVLECRESIDAATKLVGDFKQSSELVAQRAQGIATIQLFALRRKSPYRPQEFLEKTTSHLTKAKQALVGTHEEMSRLLARCQEIFQSDSDEIRSRWAEFTKKTDQAVGAALVAAVRSALREVERVVTCASAAPPLGASVSSAMTEESKAEMQPVLHVNVALAEGSGAVYQPSLDDLSSLVLRQCQAMLEVTSAIGHLNVAAKDDEESAEAFRSLVDKDDEVQATLKNIEAALQQPRKLAQEYVAEWEKNYSILWSISKDEAIRAYAAQPGGPRLAGFEEEIKRYQDYSTEVDRAESLTAVGYLLVDCSPLKVSLIGQCNTWQARYTGLINELAAKELRELHATFDDIVHRLQAPPNSLESLRASMELLQAMAQGQDKLEARFEPLDAMYRLLKKSEVQIDPSELALKEALPTAWATFKQTLVDAEQTIKVKKDKFKAELVQGVKDFAGTVARAREDFISKGPSSSALSVEQALRQIGEFRSYLAGIVEKDNELKSGLAIFGMEAPVNRELAAVQKDLDMLESVWKLTEEWGRQWDEWRTVRFLDIDTQKMEDAAHGFQKKLIKLGKEIKGMEVWVALKERVDQFAAGMPLIVDLKNPAMRNRHWERLKEEVGKPFDPTSPLFTLGTVISLGLDGFADAVGAISLSATKEMAIEQKLKEIDERWEHLDLDIVPHKDNGHHKLHDCDEVFQVLDDHKVLLTDMKASRYFGPFENQVERWERNLSRVLETLEMLLKVQRLWLYLENIFTATEDIRRQLPAESAIFEKVDHAWKHAMDRMAKDPNALRSTTEETLLDALTDMNSKLEKIQHSLNQYLENKRRIFPRFYFISDRDLLEILGNTKDPTAVQKHLIKCFDGIAQLELMQQQQTQQQQQQSQQSQSGDKGRDARRRHDATKMISPEGEEVAFVQPVACEGGVENWLQVVEEQMVRTLNKELAAALISFAKFRKDKQAKQEKFLRSTPSQLIVAASEISWTANCTHALSEIEAGSNKAAMADLRKRQASLLRTLSDMVRSPLTPLSRLKLVALLTIEIHHRDVIERLIHDGVSSDKDFGWKSQLRFYWEKDEEELFIRQTDFAFQYGYEFLGNPARLVITPLTEKVYLALTTALMLKKGSNPQGPAGTGKTETVKDLSKAMAKWCVVVNASEKVDVSSMARSLAGLSQSGVWACFDEFNRIDTDVLSVVAIQISSILNAIAAGKRRFVFPMFEEIVLKPGCGIFVTMNPGYAGRSELPDNLKSLFRPVVMWSPDSAMIAEIMLFAEGFKATKSLSRKIVTLFQLCSQQLSKQDHYDFTLRSIKSVLVMAGALKRKDPEGLEELLLLRALRDMNLPKFVGEDIHLFLAILAVLFPGVEMPDGNSPVLQGAIEAELTRQGLQVHPALVQKVMQLYDTKCTRHGVMIVGKSGSGKSTCWRILADALTRLAKEKAPGWPGPVRWTVINPKALSLEELYGCYDEKTHEWSEGVVCTVMRNCSAAATSPVVATGASSLGASNAGNATTATATENASKQEQKWIVFDGPVSTEWIESMNSVLDDNKILTPVNGERIFLSPHVSLLFEVEDLKQASPATVSRCGMIYMDVNAMGWRPFVESWIAKRKDVESRDHLKSLFNKYVQPTLDFKHRECVEVVPVSDLHAVRSLCNLYEAVASPENGVNPQDADFYFRMIELWFLFCLIWSVGASVNEEGRKKMDMFLRELEGQFPRKDTVYDYVPDPQRKGWISWEEKLPQGWRYNPKDPFHKILVPTIDSLRNAFLVTSLVKKNKHVLLVGASGVGKTVTAESVLSSAGLAEQYNVISLLLSARTTSRRMQEFVEGYVDKRTMNVFVPRGGKKLVAFIDDLNLPRKDTFGSQPPLELLRMWLDYDFWYDRAQITPNYIRDMQLVCAMAPPGGGRNEISQRLLSRFNVIHVTFPEESQVRRIFGTIISQKLQDFEEEVKPLGDLMTQTTWEIYQSVTTNLLPTPTRSHYVFNLRDMSKVFQGLLQAHPDRFNTSESMVKLWVHETLRVFGDRLADDEGRQWFMGLLMEKLNSTFGVNWVKLFRDSRSTPLFTEIGSGDDPVYFEQPDIEVVRKALELSLEEYNVTQAMDLVLFRDATQHVCRIHRIIRQPRGHALLVGLGGSGRQSLCRLATFAAGYKLFTVDVRKGFRESDFRDRIKELYAQAAIEGKPTVFMFSDTQALRPAFIEDVASILSSGEVPNLYTSEEMAQVCEATKSALESAASSAAPEAGGAATSANGKVIRTDQDWLYSQLIERARANIHVVLVMSPVGDKFRNLCRQFPAIINCTTIDWFTEWPADALKEVAHKLLAGVSPNDQLCAQLAAVAEGAHVLATSLSSQMYQQLRRQNHVTPSNFLELLRCFKELYERKRKHLESEALKLENGLAKLDDTKVKVEELGETLREMQKLGAKLQRECDEALVVIVQQKQEASDQAKVIEQQEQRLTKEEQEIKEEQIKAQAELDKAMPAFDAAKKALKSLDRRDLGEIRTYQNPLPLTEKVMQAVMVLRGTTDTSWAEAKKQLADIQFIPQLLNYEIESVTDAMLKKIDKYVIDPDFRPEKVQRESTALMSLCAWVHAVDTCAHAHREVAPKQQALALAIESMKKNAAALEEARKNLKAINEKLDVLRADHASKVSEKDKLAAQAAETELKITRASRLVGGLSSERVRWEGLISQYRAELEQLPGNCLSAAAFLAYMGPFPHEFREEFMRTHPSSVAVLIESNKVPHSTEPIGVTDFISDRVSVREWTSKGLPNDPFSVDNGTLVMPSRWTTKTHWPYMVDPEGQANKWIKWVERDKSLKVCSAHQDDLMRTLENSIQLGHPVLIEDVGADLDPSLDPILLRKLTKIGSRDILKIDDGKELEYHPDFRLYLTTKLANPALGPEISTKCVVVNFAVREQGLQQQLLGTVVMHERRQLEEQKSALVLKIAEAQKTLSELEERILSLLSTSQGSLLDDEVLVNALENAKKTSEEMKQQLDVNQKTEVKIDHARHAFVPCAVRAAALFFVLKDLAIVDTMYQFSLDYYVSLFNKSLASSPESEDLQERIKSLNEFHTLNVYRTTCRSLFEQHKTLFAFQLCAKVLESEKKVNRDEYQFFLRGGAAAGGSAKETQLVNPCKDWLPEREWENVAALDKLLSFKNFCSSFEQNAKDWKEWYLRPEPETVPLPGEWENKCSELQHLILVRVFREDRILSAVNAFVSSNIGPKFTEPPPFDPQAALEDSSPTTPLLFVLSPGVDPLDTVQQLAVARGMAEKRFVYHALGQGQEARSMQLVEEGAAEGKWVFLANAHLMVSWMPKLEKLLDEFVVRRPHEQFRLWLSSRPHEQFPATLLQRSVKITTQPPKGLKQNLLRLLRSSTNDASFNGHQRMPQKYRKMFFALAFFHSVLLERSKFLSLGWNTTYDFNDSDFNVSELLLSKFLEEYEDIPWQALRFIVSEINYGGRVTDRWDMHVLSVYAKRFFCPELLGQNFRFSALQTYFVPEDGPLQVFRDYVASLPHSDRPEVFGQHSNADIASLRQEGAALLSYLITMQPRVTSSAASSSGAKVSGDAREQKLIAVTIDLLKRVPEEIDGSMVTKLKKDDPTNPLLTVLSHEIDRYNSLLGVVRTSLVTLQRGLKGLVAMSAELDEMANCLYDSRVPPAWKYAYPSVRPLSGWVTDLLQRVDMFSTWAQDRQPKVFWLGGFTFPTGFLTALQQKYSLKNNVSIDTLSFEFTVLRDQQVPQEAPADGALVSGVFLEGASWDEVNGCLREPNPLELVISMPVIHIRPVESKRKPPRDANLVYDCPCYFFPVRDNSNREKPSYMLTVELPAGKERPDYWTLRGTALLLTR